MNILISGLINIETTIAVKGFPIDYYPIDYPFFGVNSHISGVGYNLAGAFGTLGDKVSLLSFLGTDDESERILRAFAAAGVSTGGISRTLKNTPVSAVLFAPDGKRQIYCDLKDIQEQQLDPDDQTVAEQINAADLICACNINFNRTLLKAAHEAHKTIATDVHVLSDIHDSYNQDFMRCADILFLSDEKLPAKPESFIRQLEEQFHNQIIVIGMGGKGAMLLDSSTQTVCRLSAVENPHIVNTVGAGDALFASFLHYYSKGLPPVEALKRAEVFASVKIGYNGASLGFSTEEQVEAVFRLADISVIDV